jgi:EAL domain-containing protein (putative c-di-GMP-specific phosphodiesterase class I)
MNKWKRRLYAFFRPRDPRRRALLWATIAALLCGVLEFGNPVELLLRTGRDAARKHPASGQIVVVGIDDKTLQSRGLLLPDPSLHADIINAANKAGAKRILLDFVVANSGGPEADAKLVAALKASKQKVTLAVKTQDDLKSITPNLFPAPPFRPHVELASIYVRYDYSGHVLTLPYSRNMDGAMYPTLAAKLAGKPLSNTDHFRIDYSIDLQTVPIVSAKKLLDRGSGNLLRGKVIIVAPTAVALQDFGRIPGLGVAPAALIQVAGAETLLAASSPVDLGWLPMVLAALLTALLLSKLSSKRAATVCGGLLLGLPVIAGVSEAFYLTFSIVPAMLYFAILGSMLAVMAIRKQDTLVNTESGLPNFNALKNEPETNRLVVVAYVRNLAQIRSSLPAESEASVIAQVAARLSIGTSESPLYHAADGTFAWLLHEASREDTEGQIEALHAMFMAPVKLDHRSIDLDVVFGFDDQASRSVINRYGSARVAATHAANEGRKWKCFDPSELDDAEWHLSILSQLDEAIDNGEVWVAFQPQLDLESGELKGAEALVRWTHPEKGEISPEEFILAAERHNRLSKLTRHVLTRAIAQAKFLNASGIAFTVSVNVSAQLIENWDLVGTVDQLLKKEQLDPSCLTLELTETAQLTDSDVSIERLEKLRAMGVNLSLDDYGTGFSTLDYVKRVPANELKIDRTFVSSLAEGGSDAVLVRSTIELAHLLGLYVIAEGIEDEAVLEILRSFGCDGVQGYFIAPPLKPDALQAMLQAQQLRLAAKPNLRFG